MRRGRLVVGLVAALLAVPAAVLVAESAAPASDGPNIVFVLTDDQTVEQLASMPYLSSKPRGGWVEFTNAYSNVPFCCPSRATVLSGQYAHHHGVNGSNGGDFDDRSTIATWLADAGYRTGLVGKYLNGYPFGNRPRAYIPPGWDHWTVFNGTGYYDYSLNQNGREVSYGSAPEDYSTDVLHREAIEFLQGTDRDQPFFLYFSPFAPHAEHLPAPRHDGDLETLAIPAPPNSNETDVSDKPAWVRGLSVQPRSKLVDQQRRAAETLLAVDEAVRGIIDELDALGELDETVIVFTSDNGFGFGAHRWMQKRCAYEECVRVPLLVRYPSLREDRTDDRLVSNVDMAPTLADIADVEPGAPVDGRSLLPLLTGEATTWRDSLLLQYQGPRSPGESPTFWAVRTPRWKYVELGTGETELYDLVRDPQELDNLAGRQEHASVVASLQEQLQQLRAD